MNLDSAFYLNIYLSHPLSILFRITFDYHFRTSAEPCKFKIRKSACHAGPIKPMRPTSACSNKVGSECQN